ncbi:hypothetical protein [Amycolatopsis jiangsuensis]|uniref:Uncharacterized protein n=1 Tax=Amycolatopsis jiangsuensis TaxID=1181879 RepID=A0A840J2X3_9PSEU|nr:hypothetical protein [Amycolatopsis jiangsuensis]MBB4687634.1 hypothetical protein [Amycolatopsis jiangsuensis]
MKEFVGVRVEPCVDPWVEARRRERGGEGAAARARRRGVWRRGSLVAPLLGAVLVPVVTAAPAPADAAPVPPPGFVLRDLPTGLGNYQFTDFAWLPDDSRG